MTYIIRVTCSDCTGIDPQGCFSGEHGYVTADHEMDDSYRVPDNPATISEQAAAVFPTHVHAERALEMLEHADDWPGPWQGVVIVREITGR